MRLAVSVPVLSTHSTVVAPSNSMAGMLRTSTCLCASRQAPSPMKIVSTTGSSSGSSAMAIVSPASTPCSQSPRARPWASVSAAASTSPATATRRTMRSHSCCVGVRSLAMCASEAPMRPSALRGPVATTRPCAEPLTTSVPEKASSPSHGVASASSVADCLSTAADSPVSSDSSTVRCDVCVSRTSAGTRSPSASSTRSPHTTSRAAMRSNWPSRSTAARGLASSRNAAIERSARRCCTKVMPITTNTKPSSISAS